MSGNEVPTVKVTVKDDPKCGEIIMNRSDYDPEKHNLVGEKPKTSRKRLSEGGKDDEGE